MRQKSIKSLEDKEYLASGRWKCNTSPGGAHHWIVDYDHMTCKYCHSTKSVDMNPLGWSKPDKTSR